MSTSPISMASSTANPTPTNSSANTSATDYTSIFMQLLSTELQSQDPTQTMDPTTMVTQMVQINQLNDVAGIYSIMQGTGGSASNSPAATPAVASPTGQSTSSTHGGY